MSTPSIGTLYKRVAGITLTLLIATSTMHSARAVELSESEVDFAVEKLEMQWSPGERYNGLTGTMNYAHTDLYLPGNGKLPIEIVRRFVQRKVGGGFTPLQNFGYMALDIPSVSYTIKAASNNLICNNSGRAGNTSILERPMTFRHGDTVKTFFGGAGGTFSTPDGWQIKCESNKGSLGYEQTFFGSLRIRRPDGIEYEMRRVWAGAGPAATALYLVHKMSDPYGNTLTYNYSLTDVSSGSVIRYGIVKLDSIAASDGRRVNINYKKVRVSPITNNTLYDTYRIDTVVSNSRDNPVKLKYNYTNNAGTLKVIQNNIATTSVTMSRGRIDTITYPTGGQVNYTYQQRLESAGVKYDTLKTRTTSDGAKYIFSYTDNGDDTFTRGIETPSAWLEYKYGHPRKPRRYGIVENHVVNSGRQIQFRRYERLTSGSRGNLLLNVDQTFANLSPSNVTNQAEQLVVPRKATVKMNYNSANSNARTTHFRQNTRYDAYGNPTRVIEGSPSTSAAISTYDYQNTGFTRHIHGKPTLISRGGDTQSYTYNQQGDVDSHTINGITTRYKWYQSGTNKGELQSQTDADNNTTSYTFYKRGQAQRTTNPAAYSINRIINDNATVASESRLDRYLPLPSAGKLGVEYEYDTLRRAKQIVPERGSSTTVDYRWNNNNHLIANDGSNARYISHTRIDGFGRTQSEGTYDRDQGRWSTIKYEYDAEGRLLFVSYPKNVSASNIVSMNTLSGTHYRYDALNRVTRVTVDENSGNNSVMTYTYGSGEGGQLTISKKDGRGFTTTTTYRSFGAPLYQWPIKIVEADGQVTTISRNALTGRVNSFTRGGQTTSYSYHSTGFMKSMTQRENGITQFTYYSNGLLKTRTNQGSKIEYKYYPDNSLRKEIYTDSSRENVTREFQYDRYRNLEYAITTSPSGSQNNTLHYRYDADNNITNQALIIDGLRYEMQYEYDELSNLREVTYPSKRSYSLNPNSLGAPTAIEEVGANGKTIYNRIQYNDNHSMKQMRRNGHQVKNELNIGQRPYSYRLEQYGNGQFDAMGERKYRYDKAANISNINDTVSKRYMTLSYDNRNRLTNENISNGINWSYGYLPNDSIDWIQAGSVRSTYEYNTSNKRLSGVRTGGKHRRYEYDAQGNMTAHERLLGGSKVTRSLTYNAANQLTAMSDGTAYGYDARGLRVKKDRNGAIYTLYDPSERLIYRFDNQAKVSSEYFYVDGKLVARRDQDRSANNSDDPTTRPNTPVTVSPAGNGASTNPSYTWKAVPGATNYVIDIREADNDTVLVFKYYTAAQAGCAQGTGNCAVQKSDVPMSGNKRWRVRAKNNVGLGGWSAFAAFTVGGSEPPPSTNVPNKPTTVSPSGNDASANPTYTWRAVPSATNYVIDIREADNDTVLVFKYYTAAQAGCAQGTGNCAVQKSDVPMSGNKRWRVRAKNKAGLGAWSAFAAFTVGGSEPPPSTTVPAVPSPAWPSGNLNTSNPVYQWIAVEGATDYYLEVQDSSNAVRIWKKYTAAEMGCTNAGDRCRITKADAPVIGANRWRIHAGNAVGKSAWSAWKSFNVSN